MPSRNYVVIPGLVDVGEAIEGTSKVKSSSLLLASSQYVLLEVDTMILCNLCMCGYMLY